MQGDRGSTEEGDRGSTENGGAAHCRHYLFTTCCGCRSYDKIVFEETRKVEIIRLRIINGRCLQSENSNNRSVY